MPKSKAPAVTVEQKPEAKFEAFYRVKRLSRYEWQLERVSVDTNSTPVKTDGKPDLRELVFGRLERILAG